MIDQVELDLVIAAQKGDAQAFGRLYDLYIKKIYDFIFYKTSHKETAEDLTSLTFTKAFEKLKGFNITLGTFSAWVYQIARNTVIDHYRSQHFHYNVDDFFDLDDGKDLNEETDSKLRLEVLKNYLKELSPEQKDVLVMRVWQEMSYAEIAAVLGKSEASCKMLYSRAVSKLKELLPLEALLVLLILQ